MSTEHRATSALKPTIIDIAEVLQALDPGPLAELRRLSYDDGAPAMFWRLRTTHDFAPSQEPAWARIIQMMAILTDKGDPAGRASPHAEGHERRLGAMLCTGGSADWTAERHRPLLSETRLARLLAAKGTPRVELLERAVRALAAAKPPRTGVNCVDLAWLVLRQDSVEPTHAIARAYYDRLDHRDRSNDGASGDAA